jgi:DNA-binding transcriptional LysR family regulator
VELLDLQIFITVSEEMSMNKASQKMYMAQSAVSNRMQNLEKELGSAMFVRSSSGVQLTQAGIYFLKYAIGSVNAIRQGEKTISDTSSKKPFMFGATPSLSVKFVPAILSHCLEQDSSMVVEIVTSSSDEILTLTRSGALDFGLIYSNTPPKDVKSFPLLQEEVLLISREPIENFGKFIIAKPFVFQQRGGKIEQHLEMLLGSLQFNTQRVIARVDHWELLLELVGRGIGNSIIFQSYWDAHQYEQTEDGFIPSRNIYIQKAPAFLPGRTVYVVWKENKSTEFIEQIVLQFSGRENIEWSPA